MKVEGEVVMVGRVEFKGFLGVEETHFLVFDFAGTVEFLWVLAV